MIPTAPPDVPNHCFTFTNFSRMRRGLTSSALISWPKKNGKNNINHIYNIYIIIYITLYIYHLFYYLSNYIVLYVTLYQTILYYTMLNYIIICCTILYYIIYLDLMMIMEYDGINSWYMCLNQLGLTVIQWWFNGDSIQPTKYGYVWIKYHGV